eukprot:scaffold93660_cov49-Prasinocladus_malaysianus.AAC.3
MMKVKRRRAKHGARNLIGELTSAETITDCGTNLVEEVVDPGAEVALHVVWASLEPGAQQAADINVLLAEIEHATARDLDTKSSTVNKRGRDDWPRAADGATATGEHAR